MAHAVAGLPENSYSRHSRDCSRSGSRSCSRSCSRSRHHTPEPPLANPALDSPRWPLPQTPLQEAASKSPRSMRRSLSAAWQSPTATTVKTPHTVSRTPRAVGRSAAAKGNTASGTDARPMPAEDRVQQSERSASLARLQRSHRRATAITQKGFDSLVKESTCQADQSQAEGRETQPAKAGSGGTELAVTAPQSEGALRRSFCGSLGLESLPSIASHGDLRVQDCLRQRPASSPPMSMLSRAPLDSGGQEMHGLSCAGASFTPCPWRQPALLQQLQQQAGLQPQPHQEEQQQQQQQEWLMQQQWQQQQQQQQQLPAACSGPQQPAAIKLGGQLQDRTMWASGPGVAQGNLGSLSAGGSHSMLVHPQHQQQHQQLQHAAVAAQLAILPRTQPDHRHSAAAAAAAALQAALPTHTNGKQAATAAECKGRRSVPGANLGSDAKQLGSCVTQTQEVLHQRAHGHPPLNQQQPSHGPIPVMVQQPARFASALACAHEVDERLQVQKLSVTPHKPSRQLSGNPFAEPAQVHPPTQHVTAQTQHAQHVPASGHDAGLSHHAEHTPTPVASAQPSMGSHDSHLMTEHRHDACCMSAAASTSGNAAASGRQHQADDTQPPSEVTGTAVSPPQKGGGPVPIVAVDSQSTVGDSQKQVAGDQTSRSLRSDLEIEAVAADAEACLLELQVCLLFTL